MSVTFCKAPSGPTESLAEASVLGIKTVATQATALERALRVVADLRAGAWSVALVDICRQRTTTEHPTSPNTIL